MCHFPDECLLIGCPIQVLKAVVQLLEYIDEIDICLFSSQSDQYADTKQSPPTEEGNPIEKESSSSIYECHMYLKAHGFPLWIPQPDESLDPSYQ